MDTIRPEAPEDSDAIHYVERQAFGQENEARLVEKLRSRRALAISLIAVEDNSIVGHIAFSPVEIEPECLGFEAVALAPVAVLPAFQNRGIGSRLIRAGLDECRRLGYGLVVLVGHADYYPRFGFVPARPKGLKCEFEVPDEAWMALELQEGVLAGKRGTVRFQREFQEAD